MRMDKKTTSIIIKKAGGPYKVAKLISAQFGKLTPQAISQWEKIPLERAVQIEKVSLGALTKEMMRPDIFMTNYPEL